MYAWGDNTYGQVPEDKSLWVGGPVFLKYFKTIYIEKIVSGKNHCGALGSSQKVYLWGDNSSLQLYGKNTTGIVACCSLDLIPSDIPAVDVEMYDNFTVILLESGLILKSSLSGVQLLHVPSNCGVSSVAASSVGVYAISPLRVLYGISLVKMKKNTHFKMSQLAEGVRAVYSGFYCSAIDEDWNLWTLEPEKKLCAEISCVKMARVTQYYTIVMLGVERLAYEREKGLRSLFEIAEEKLLDMVVRIM